MKAKVMTWWRAYTRMLDDDKIKLLAFEDRWHYVAICHMKRAGILDSEAPHRDRRIAAKMDLPVTAALEAKRRIIDVGLIDDDWQPLAWDKCQFESDSSAVRTRRYREKRHGDGAVTSHGSKCDATDSETESEEESDTDTPPSRRRGSTRGERAPQRARARPSKRLPSGFVPSTDLRAWAATEAPLVDFSEALATIKDHEFKDAHTDWEAVIRNWLRRDQKAAEQRSFGRTRAPAQEPLFRDDDTSLDGIDV